MSTEASSGEGSSDTAILQHADGSSEREEENAGQEATRLEQEEGWSYLTRVDESTLRDPTYVVGDPFFFPHGHVSALGARRGAGKTTVATNLGVHVAAGVEWMGARVEAGRVLYLDYEGVAAQVVELRDLSIAFLEQTHPGVGSRVRRNFVIHSVPAAVKAQGNYLDERIKELTADLGQDFDLVIVDGFAAAFKGDPNDADVVFEKMNALLMLAQESGASVLFLDHTPKTGALTLTGSGRKEDLVRSLHFLKVEDKDLVWKPDKITFGPLRQEFKIMVSRSEDVLSLARGQNTVLKPKNKKKSKQFKSRVDRPSPGMSIEDATMHVLYTEGPLAANDLHAAVARAIGRVKESTVKKALTTKGLMTRLLEEQRVEGESVGRHRMFSLAPISLAVRHSPTEGRGDDMDTRPHEYPGSVSA